MTFKQVLYEEWRGNRHARLFIKEDVTADAEVLKEGVEENISIMPDVVRCTTCLITLGLIPG